MPLRLSLVATALVLAAMWCWSIPALDALTGGVALFDTRLTGYGPEDARRLLEALGPAGRALYLSRQQVLDTAFPALLALSIILAARRYAAPRPARLIFVLAAIYAGFDYGENILVARMLAGGSEALKPDLVQMASRMTVAKFASLALTLAVLGLAVLFGSRNIPAR